MASFGESGFRRPLLRLWISQAVLRLGYIPLPRDAPHVHSSGSDSVRMLLVGNGLALGYGVLSHNLGLAGALVRALSPRIHRGIDIVANHRMTARSALAELEATDLARYDSVIVTVGINEALAMRDDNVAWREDVRTLLRHLDQRAVTAFVIGIPTSVPRKGHRNRLERFVHDEAVTLNEILREESVSGATLTFIPLAPVGLRRFAQMPTRLTYESWAAQLAPFIAPALQRARRRLIGQDETERQLALEALGILDTAPEETFDSITSTARRLFGTWGAAVTFIDGERQWIKAAEGMPPDDIARSDAFCDVTIRSHSLFVVRDALLDDRFNNSPLVKAGNRIRFYAGYPIETPDGLRVGALCVMNKEPRDFSNSDEALLRDLALRVQDELWARGGISEV